MAPVEPTEIDPVCGMKVTPQTAAASCQESGRTWYFCGQSCYRKFVADPAKFQTVPPAGDTPSSTAPRASKYTCPMHPEVVSDRPGSCPKCGMALEPILGFGMGGESDETSGSELAEMTRRLQVCAALTLPLLAVMLSELLHSHPLNRILPYPLLGWMEFALATPVVLWGGWPFFQRAWDSIRHRSPNMFTLIAMGTGAAYLYSLAAIAAPGIFPPSFRDSSGRLGLYFESAAVITVLVLLGQVFELKARSNTGSAIRSLLALAPKTALRIAADGSEMEVSAGEIQVEDLLRIRPGESIPTDGIVVEGSSFVNESMLTGEPTPVAKAAGATVIGGSINGNAGFVMRAERVGEATLLAQIVRMVGEAQRSRAPIQRLADVVASYFVPAVVASACITFAIWAIWGPAPHYAHALVNAIAVLIIACPCALGLATPMSIMVGTGRAAQEGILIRDAEALELLEKVNLLVVDKTGTLTEGRPRLKSVIAAAGFQEEQILQSAASLERASEHPLASAIMGGAGEKNIELLPVAAFQAIPGKGIAGDVNGIAMKVGSAAFIEAQGVSVESLREWADALRNEGHTVVFAAMDGRFAGILAVGDAIKKSTFQAVHELKRDGIRVVMVTGDHGATAKAVAQSLGIEFRAGVLPGDKAQAIREYQDQGAIVAMAGDGVNDAPALAQAHVGIAMGTGADVAKESGGIVLVKGNLLGIVRARLLSHRTMANIRQNLFFAFIYNALGVPLAAGILYPAFGLLLNPMIAAAAMSLSSVSVIANALRLRSIDLSVADTDRLPSSL